MTDIKKLMSKLCPNGVKHMPLQEVFDIKEGSKFVRSDRNLRKGRIAPWFESSSIIKNGESLDDAEMKVTAKSQKKAKYLPPDSLILAISGDFGKHAHVTVPYLINEDLVSLALKPCFHEKIDLRFVNYFCFILGNWVVAKRKRNGVGPLNIDELRSFKFPIPPLPVQREIVSILDDFANMEKVLETELKLRRKQCEYYLNYLMSFDKTDENSMSNTVRWQTMGEIGKFVKEIDLQKNKQANYDNFGFIEKRQILNHKDISADHAHKKTSDSEFVGCSWAKKGDLVIVSSSDRYDEVCKAFAWLGDRKVLVDFDVAVFRHSLVPKFLAYYFKSSHFRKQKMSFLTGAIDLWIDVDSLKKVIIPVPPIREQERIVNVLDQLYLFVNDNSVGLPAEISARHKQFRHYLSKVFRFKELNIMTEAEKSELSQREFVERTKLFVDALNVDEVIGQLLATKNFATVEDLIEADNSEILAIEGFDIDTVANLKARAQEYLEEVEEQNIKDYHNLGVSEDLRKVTDMNTEMMVALGN